MPTRKRDQEEVASPRVAEEWSRRVVAEYRSAALTAQLAGWLIEIGASPDLIRMALRIVDDELVHAELAHAVTQALGVKVPPIERRSLRLSGGRGPRVRDVARVGVALFCLGETLAVRLFRALRQECRRPLARAALDRILRDEVRHRDFGWQLLGWLLASQPALRSGVVHALPGQLRALRASYAPALGRVVPLDEEERAWGLVDPPEYAAILERTELRDLRPRFARLGITLPT